MISYLVKTTNPHRHFISFRGVFPTNGKLKLQLKLSAWRPGRYELGQFAKNIRAWKCMDANDRELAFQKTDSNTWEIESENISAVTIEYEYYAHELNAGSSYLNELQLYINPVNCFFYDPDTLNDAYEIQFELPANYQIASGLPSTGTHRLLAENFDQLADSPLITSDILKHYQYTTDGKIFHIWIQGEIHFDIDQLLLQFQSFTHEQLKLFGTLPCDEYHFLFQFPPFYVRHGVEHNNSTVIAIGPAETLSGNLWYNELLGISCHELFHTWNVKCFRPVEMTPYDYSRENYSQLGYVYEGVTTYYGDLMLLRAGVFTEADFFEIVNETLEKHFHNLGRANLSVAESSWDTWLDGYTIGIPWRKVSIYNEGCMLAFICDIYLRMETSNKKSLDDVLRMLYEEYGKRKLGYTTNDYWNLIEKVAGRSFQHLRSALAEGTVSYRSSLDECLAYLGMAIEMSENKNKLTAIFGFKMDWQDGIAVVTRVYQNSPADVAGIWINCKIVCVDGVAISGKDAIERLDLSTKLDYVFEIQNDWGVKKVPVIANEERYFSQYCVKHIDNRSEAAIANYEAWRMKVVE